VRAPLLLVFTGLAAISAGCGLDVPDKPPSFPSTGSASYGSTPHSAPDPGVPSREAVTAGFVVRPDLACFPFALRTIAADAPGAVQGLKEAADALSQRIAAAGGAGVKVRMRGFAISPSGHEKAEGAQAKRQLAAVADGAFDVPLPAGLDYWGRSRLIASIGTALSDEIAARKEKEKGVKLSVEPVKLQVSDPEVHRAKLVEQWVKRARAFAEAAKEGAAPLQVLDCAPPGEIAQRSISNEEVGLTLSITCKLDAPRLR
jgi:hypothetical protein